MANYGRDYIGAPYTIIGAGGQILNRDDAEADMLLQRISGWGDAEIVGAAPMLMRQSPALLSRAQQTAPRVAQLLNPAMLMNMRPMMPSLLMPQGQPGPSVHPSEPGPVGLALIPMNNGSVAAGAQAVIAVQPQSIFKPYRLTVDPVIASFFVISNLQIGTVPLFDAPGEVPCSNFPPNLQQGNLKKITANPGIQVSMTIRNRDGAAHPFWSSLFGEAAPTQCG